MSEFTKNDMELLEQRITANVLAGVVDRLDAAFEKQEKRLTALFDKDFEYIKESLAQHKKWHEKHFEREDKFDKRISDAQLGTRHEVEAENDKQNVIIAELTKAITANSDRLTVIESEARGKHAQLALIIAVVGAVGVLIWEIAQGMIG